MQLKLRAYKGFILKFLIPFLMSFVLLIISMSIYLYFHPEDIENLLLPYFFSIAAAVVIFCSLFFIKFYNCDNYIFDKNKIEVYRGKKFVMQIDIKNIKAIYYHPFKLRDMVTVFMDERMGVWKLHIKLIDGTKKSLAFFSIKDVKKIKEIYGDLMEIV